MGWDIFIELSSAWPRGMGGHGADSRRPAQLLAYWSADDDGLDWMRRLVSNGRASVLSESRYPVLFSVPAGDLLPVLTPAGLRRIDPRLGVAVDASSFFHRHLVTIRREAIAACPQGAILTVEAWDQSHPAPRLGWNSSRAATGTSSASGG